MKLFKQVNVGNEFVIIDSYNREMTPKEIFIVSHIEQTDEDPIKKITIFQKDDPGEEFDFYANSNQSFMFYWPRNYIITPKENFQHIQKIFNVGYLLGENNIRTEIKDILHI